MRSCELRTLIVELLSLLTATALQLLRNTDDPFSLRGIDLLLSRLPSGPRLRFAGERTLVQQNCLLLNLISDEVIARETCLTPLIRQWDSGIVSIRTPIPVIFSFS